MTDGERMLRLAETRIGQKYVNVCVPKNNPNWQGPWDCAEFMSWLVYQTKGYLYGCLDNESNPATVEAYTGAWRTDCDEQGIGVSVQKAASTRGGILLRYPPSPGSMGHIVVCDGEGGTVEAMGKAYGVKRGKVSGRVWDTGVFLPGFSYDNSYINAVQFAVAEPEIVYGIGRSGMNASVIREIQRALDELGFDPGGIDGDYGHNTAAAVGAFQATKGLVVDGMVGQQTARRLKIKLR